ncbi:uncharacterized protein LOC134534399 [Bacillus rossius redtenbacheri]|uniref:uncharacterized protein LOC134534399 n=1 Tax=Bacillus rossius redtenbacheri TaxID=93214 RepID=UPI002FDCD485
MHRPSVVLIDYSNFGFFCCGRCRVAGQWEALGDLMQARGEGAALPPGLLPGRAASEAGRQWQQLRRSCPALAELPQLQRSSLLRSFHLPQSESLPQLEGRVHSERQELYFPLLDGEGQVVGYKRLRLEGRVHSERQELYFLLLDGEGQVSESLPQLEGRVHSERQELYFLLLDGEGQVSESLPQLEGRVHSERQELYFPLLDGEGQVSESLPQLEGRVHSERQELYFPLLDGEGQVSESLPQLEGRVHSERQELYFPLLDGEGQVSESLPQLEGRVHSERQELYFPLLDGEGQVSESQPQLEGRVHSERQELYFPLLDGEGQVSESLPQLEGRVHSERQELYFPLLDSEGQVSESLPQLEGRVHSERQELYFLLLEGEGQVSESLPQLEGRVHSERQELYFPLLDGEGQVSESLPQLEGRVHSERQELYFLLLDGEGQVSESLPQLEGRVHSERQELYFLLLDGEGQVSESLPQLEGRVHSERQELYFPLLDGEGQVSESLPQLEGRVHSERQELYFPLLDGEGQVVGYKRLLREEPREQTVPQTGCGGVLALSPDGGASEDAAVLVSSVADLLALARHHIPARVVCLPYGFAQLPQEALPSLERHSKLVLWLGGDAAGWDAARTFARKLGERRCHLVRPTVGRLSPHEAVRAGLEPRDIVLSARPVLHQAITTFSSLREDVLSELHNIDKVAGVKWKRFQALNRILKGHRRGELTVLTGPTGSGKTTLVSELSLDLACQGVNTLWASFEIRNTRLARTMLQQLAGKPLDKDLEQLEVWADRLERLPLYFTTWHGQQAPRAVMEALEHAAYVHDIAHVVIDNVQFLLGVESEGQHGDRFWRQDALVASFRHFATHRNCHVTLVMHPRKERDSDDLSVSSIFGSAKAAQEADNILIIQDKRLSSVRGKKYLQVAKNRYTGDLGVVALEFHKEGLSFAARKKKAEKPSEPSS